MLPDRAYQLLTAAVDGELSGREQGALEKLLHESAEAREFYRKLKSDADGLRNLPRAQLPPHFATTIVHRVSPLSRPQPSTQDGFSRRLPAWANLAAAAAVLLAISVGTYLVMVLSENDRTVVKNENPAPPSNLPSPRNDDPPSIARNNGDTEKKKEPEQLPVPPIEIVDAGNPETPKAVDPGSTDVLAANPKASVDKLFTVELPKLPPILAVRDLDQNGSRQKLFDALKKNDGVHLDLFCKDTNRAFERLQTAFKGQRLLIDAVAQERLQRKLKTHYVFYSEALTADEIQTILHSLAAEERKVDAKKEGQFDKLVANPLSPNSVKTLSMLLGVDPKWLQSKPKSSAPAIDLTKPLSDSTADSLAKSLKSGSSLRGGERLVLVMPYNPIRPNPQASKEVRQFLDSVPKERKPGTIPLLLVLRTAEN